MAEFGDPDVQEELEAMAGASKVIFSGANRMTNRGEMRSGKLSRQIFSGDNSATSMNMLNNAQQFGRSLSPPPTSMAVLSSTEKAAKMELEAILRRPAHTPEEKFLVLDARDKLIRLTTARNLDIKNATMTKGVCPDMCPEKERMSREAKHRVANLELVDGTKATMNHSIAVKEYSRSSADQETPLPHELRPEPVLKLTMTYLLQNIMDLCDDPDTSIGDWYHFLWDRTRSIRKDITQQELCSTETVLLVEQCARFHIHCAARLVAEEPQVFDQKINTENLTKCLQSLKYIYHDLGLKMIRCPNEAEFRAYVVLLNLHDSNFLWEVKQLREEILQSPEIQFAIKVYLALESNNYVRFFSLVRSTTYMNACILLRYFTQVRNKAIRTMFKAYASRNAVYMPISNLTYLLAFEEFEQCAQYLEYYGLTCDRDEDRALFDRNSFYFPDMSFILDRAINVVEHKRHSTVGEAVSGCSLDSKSVLEKYEPHDSFDENGILLPKAWSADDQNYYKPEARIEARRNKTQSPSAKEDESIFKMPQVPARTSKSRLSPKTVVSSENATTSASNTTPLFTSSKLAPSAQNNQSGGSFKIQPNQTNNIFVGFDQTSTQTNPFNSSNGSSNTLIFPQSKATDTADGGTFRFTGNTPFGKPSENTANSIFPGIPKTESGTNLFAQVKTTSNPFVNAASSNAPSIFGGFAAASSNQPENNAGIIRKPNFQKTTSSNENTGSNIFGGFRNSSTSIPGIVPLKDTDNELARKLERENEEARLKEIERQRKEVEEIERKKRADLEEKERQRKKSEAEEKEKQKRLEIEVASKKFVECIIEEFVTNYLEEVANAEIKRHRAIEEAMNQIYMDLLHNVIDTKLTEIALDVKSDWDKNILEKYFAYWRAFARKKIEQRQKISNTPIWLPRRSIQEMIPELHHPWQSKTLGLMKRYRSGWSSKLIAPPIREDSIDLWSIVAPELMKLSEQNKGRQMQNIYWKCVISLPDTNEDPACKIISQWLDNVFYRQLSKYPRKNDTFFVEQHESNNQRLNVCMRKLSGKRMINESETTQANDVKGTNAILFVSSTKNMNATRERLKAILKAIELNSAVALMIYSMETHDLNEVKNELNLYELLDNQKIDECIFANGMRNWSNDSLCYLLKHSLRYAAANSFYDDTLEMQRTVSFLRICLADELWQRIYLSVSRNPTLLEASTRFKFLVDYHNEAINRLTSICTPHCIETPTLFPSELRQFVSKHQLDIPLSLEFFPENWHTTAKKHHKAMTEFLKSLQIHQELDLKDVSEIPALETMILRFVGAHISAKSEAERTAYKMIQHILAYLDPTNLDRLEFKEKLAKYSWLDAFPIFATDLLSFQHQRFVNERRLPDFIIYEKYEYLEYIQDAWWLQTNVDLLKDITVNVLQNIDVAVDEYEHTCKRQRLEETVIAAEEKKKLDDILTKGYASLETANKTLNRIKEIQSTCKDISKDLDYDLYKIDIAMRDTKDKLKHFKE